MTEEIQSLIISTAARSERDFKRLVGRTSPLLFGVLLRMLKDRVVAEEALQAVYLKVWTKAHTYRPGEAEAMAWLVTIARYHAIDLLRARGRRLRADEVFEDVHPDDRWTGERRLIAVQETEAVFRCLATLPDDRAEAIRLAYIEGCSYQELAERFAIPLNTIRTWLRRGLQQLRECFENAG